MHSTQKGQILNSLSEASSYAMDCVRMAKALVRLHGYDKYHFQVDWLTQIILSVC